MFSDFLMDPFTRSEQNLKCNITETKENYLFEFDVPGIPKDKIEVSLEKNDLTIKVDRPRKKTDESKTLLSERPFGSFKRTFALPEVFDPESVEAQHTDGVLHVKIPKTTKPFKTIAIR